MRYHALACDYDGTLATHGTVDAETLAGLQRVLASGRKLIMVTGRELEDLLEIFPQFDLFAWIVAENGALLYRPSTRQQIVLAEPPPIAFVEELRRRGVAPLSVGRAIVATFEPHEATVLQVIREQGLGLQVIFNKGAVMVLPSGVTKRTGLKAALKELELTPHETVGVGDAENDHAFLSLCECGVAVANALPAVKDTAELVTRGRHGAGVVELIDQLVESDLQAVDRRLTRHHLLLGTQSDGTPLYLPPFGPNVLVAGPSGSGKSNVATSLVERLQQQRYQFCIIDPEGDYSELPLAVVLGGRHGPTIEEVLQVLKHPQENAVVNLVGLPITDRPLFFLELFPRLQEMRSKTGRPHWLIVDETHHVLPAAWLPGTQAIPQELNRVVFITVHPELISTSVAATVGTLIAVGNSPQETIERFATLLGESPPASVPNELDAGEIVVWRRYTGESPLRVRLAPSQIERRRHTRKYAEGELPPERSFFFRGPQRKLKLRAQNLILFLQLADGVDDETWLHHLQAHDVSAWFREGIKDDVLACEAEGIEQKAGQVLSPDECRTLVRELVERHYTLPGAAPLPVPGAG